MAALPLTRERIPAQRVARPTAEPTIRAGRSTATRPTSARPSLVLVEPKRRRWPALIAGLAWTFIVVGLLATAVFHTQLAERQLEIDRLDRAVAAERDRFDELRYQRAAFRSPVRLAAAAGELGMHRGRASTFISVAPDALARQLATAGPIDDSIVQIVMHNDPLDQFRAVKSVTGEQP